MRSDMAKVIVERPRTGGGWSPIRKPRPVGDAEDLPRHEGIRRPHRDRKRFNEYLAPLRRFLLGQAGRPWRKVQSEIQANLRLTNAVQRHVLEHVAGYVAVHVRITEDGRVIVLARRGREWPIERTGALLYVHPVTGILRLNKRPPRRRNPGPQRTDLAPVSATLQHACLHGVWYAITLAPLATALPTQRDLVLGRTLEAMGAAAPQLLAAAHGRSGVIAIARRQLNKRELRAAGLENRTEPEPKRAR